MEHSELSIIQTLKEMDIARSTFYVWYCKYQEYGPEGLLAQKSGPQQYWNRIPESVREQIFDLALTHPDKSCRQIAWMFVDEYGYYVSESSVHRILKGYDLVTSPVFEMISAKDKNENPTKEVHALWQTDFPQFTILNWGYYYLSTILDDYSRFIIAWRLSPSMGHEDVEETLKEALAKSALERVRVRHKPRLLSDNGSAYISKDLREFLEKRLRAYSRCVLSPLEPGQDRVLASLDEKCGQVGQLLYPRGTQDRDRRICRVLQSRALS